MRKSNITIWVMVVVLLALPCFAITITVDDDGPADFDNIQDAIDNASDWDVVEVQPGTYYEDINFLWEVYNCYKHKSK